MKRKLLAYFVLSTSLALVATAWGASHAEALAKAGKFEWTTESADAKKLIHELQSRIENFQLEATRRSSHATSSLRTRTSRWGSITCRPSCPAPKEVRR